MTATEMLRMREHYTFRLVPYLYLLYLTLGIDSYYVKLKPHNNVCMFYLNMIIIMAFTFE